MLGLSMLTFAQEAVLSLETDSLLIGEQSELYLTFGLPAGWSPEQGTSVMWPALDSISLGGDEKELEVLRSAVDTLKDGDAFSLVLKSTITPFDTGYFVIEPLKVSYKGVEYESNASLLYVGGPEISANAVPLDIKDIRSVRYTFWDRLFSVLPYALAGALLLLLIYIGIRLLKRKKSLAPAPEVVVPQRLPHEIAFEALDALKSKKLWEKGHIKDYHVALNDIIRNYISARYGVKTLERTSREIMADLRLDGIEDDLLLKLQGAFRTSDMAKFAKFLPSASENERVFENIYQFVDRTKQMPAK